MKREVAFITGTTSNLGISVSERLVDELEPNTKLTIIVSSRTMPKAIQTIEHISKYAWKLHKNMQLELDYVLFDFTDMVSILAAYYDVVKKYKKIDYLVIISAQTCYDGIDWMGAVKEILASPVQGVTNPEYKIQRVGCKSGDGMGLLFQGNAFGPYYLIHKLKEVLKGGKIIWVSSTMSQQKHLSFDDIEALKSPGPYECSKRLVDLIHLATYKSLKSQYNIQQYVVNPGIFTSAAFYQYLNFVTYYGMLMLFYLARFLGSPIHNITGYNASNSIMKCILEDDERQDSKIVSCTDRSGRQYVAYDEIDPTGAEDVVAYMNSLCKKWDEEFKDQIVDTRKL